VSPNELTDTSAELMKPTLVQLAESIKLQFEHLRLALTSEYEERKKR
jgi:hypothetical protein